MIVSIEIFPFEKETRRDFETFKLLIFDIFIN